MQFTTCNWFRFVKYGPFYYTIFNIIASILMYFDLKALRYQVSPKTQLFGRKSEGCRLKTSRGFVAWKSEVFLGSKKYPKEDEFSDKPLGKRRSDHHVMTILLMENILHHLGCIKPCK